jgi:hypothetical protein
VTVLLPGAKLAIDQMLQGATERRRARSAWHDWPGLRKPSAGERALV